jgi:predicted esterase
MCELALQNARVMVGVLALLLAGCRAPGVSETNTSGKERISARPLPDVSPVAPGTYNLMVASPNDAILLVPSTITEKVALPLVVMLHGAGGTPATLEQVLQLGQQYGFAVLVPKSRGATWDLALGAFGEDVVVIDKALTETFKRVRVDAGHIALAGFSDGASYALSLGLANGDLFTHIIAFSPGFVGVVPHRGKPAFFLGHGNGDGVLPVATTRDNIAPFLRQSGYSVKYYEFPGGHRVDSLEADTAFHWFLGVN